MEHIHIIAMTISEWRNFLYSFVKIFIFVYINKYIQIDDVSMKTSKMFIR